MNKSIVYVIVSDLVPVGARAAKRSYLLDDSTDILWSPELTDDVAMFDDRVVAEDVLAKKLVNGKGRPHVVRKLVELDRN
jgi:hypothetical protein